MVSNSAPSTTIKLSVATRDRIRELGGETYEETIIEALDALETDHYWAQADAAAAWQNSLPAAEALRRRKHEAEINAALDRIG